MLCLWKGTPKNSSSLSALSSSFDDESLVRSNAFSSMRLILSFGSSRTSYDWEGFFATTKDRIALEPAIVVSTGDNGRSSPVIRRPAE